MLAAAADDVPAAWWRVGFHTAAAEFVPFELSTWENRFDDPEREFRTLYCAEWRVTCVREMLADLRPNANARAELAQLQLKMGVPEAELFEPARKVTKRWRAQHVLARVRLHRDGPVADLDDVPLRQALEHELASVLRRHGMVHLDISEVRSRVRPVTQRIARTVQDHGAAGVLFRSNLDDARCVAVFEHRGRLTVTGTPEPLTQEVPELRQVCAEFGLET